MTLGKSRHILARRRTWLVARAETRPPNQRSRDLEEIEALDMALALLNAAAPPLTPVADVAAATERSFAHARENARRNATECSCSRCPVHGGGK